MEIEITSTSIEQQYILKVKLSVAFAILRNKPAGVSTICYVEDIMSTYQMKMAHLSHTSQDIDRNQLISCQNELITLQESNPSLFHDTDSIILTPPPSGKSKLHTADTLESLHYTLIKHSTFLQGSFNLRSVSNLLREQHQVTKIIEQTAADSIKIIYSLLLTDSHKIIEPSVSLALEESVKLCDLLPYNSNLRNSLKMFTTEFLTTVIKKVIFNDNVTQIKKLNYIKLLCQFMFCEETKELLLNALFNCTRKFFSYIKKLSLKTQKLQDPAFLENNYYILSCLAECLVKATNNQNLMPSQHFLSELTTSVKSCFFLIQELFPLINHALWQLHVVINDIPHNRNGKSSKLIYKRIIK